MSDNCIYTDPQGQTSNREKFLDHHAQFMADWILCDAGGVEVQPGSSWAHYGEDGRITNVSGFFDMP